MKKRIRMIFTTLMVCVMNAVASSGFREIIYITNAGRTLALVVNDKGTTVKDIMNMVSQKSGIPAKEIVLIHTRRIPTQPNRTILSLVTGGAFICLRRQRSGQESTEAVALE